MRKLIVRLAMFLAVAAPPVLHTGCVREMAYQVRLEQEARKHVYDVSRSKLVAEVKKAAEDDGWKVTEGEDDGGPDLIGAPRTKNGRKERLVVSLVKSGDGFKVEADLEVKMETPNGKTNSLQRAAAIEIAVFESLDPKAADKAKVAAKAKAKEDAKMIRACARRAVDAATDEGND